jgi:hypothetical protein
MKAGQADELLSLADEAGTDKLDPNTRMMHQMMLMMKKTTTAFRGVERVDLR